MQNASYRRYARWLHGLVGLSVFAYALAVVWVQPVAPGDPLQVGAAAALLTLATVLGAAMSLRVAPRRSPRVALTFVLAAMVLLPMPGALLVALPALVLSGGGGVVGPFQRGLPWFAAAGVAVAFTQFAVAPWSVGIAPDSLSALAAMGAAWAIMQALAWGVSYGMGEQPELTDEVRGSLVTEALNVPLAWLLATQLAAGNLLASAAATLLAIGMVEVIGRWFRASAELREQRFELQSRLSELDTLNAIGQELISTLELGPLFATIDRECCKVFDIDFCQIALCDPDHEELRTVYRRFRGEEPDYRERPLRVGLPRRVAERRRGVFVRDLRLLPGSTNDLAERDLRSAMAVPLRVGQRAIGVLHVASRRPGAYDEHRLTVLGTVAQQVAVAVENARNFRMATIDSLTGFYTRARFFDAFQDEHRRVTRYGGVFSVLMLDLDGFKKINDSHGHLAGDKYLQGIAETVRHQLRDADLPCRYGGDEFCVLLPATDVNGARAIAERIRAAVAARFVRDGSAVLRGTVSVGVAAFPTEESGGDSTGVLRHADEALYRAKRAGRNRVVA